MVLRWSPFNSVSYSPALHSKWLLLLKIEISLVVIFCFITNQNELKFNCSYMAMSSLTYILGFSVRFFQPVYSVLGTLWDKIHIKIFYSEIWGEMIFEWPTFKIMCNTPIFYFNFRCQIEKQVSDYRLLGAFNFMVPHVPVRTKILNTMPAKRSN